VFTGQDCSWSVGISFYSDHAMYYYMYIKMFWNIMPVDAIILVCVDHCPFIKSRDRGGSAHKRVHFSVVTSLSSKHSNSTHN